MDSLSNEVGQSCGGYVFARFAVNYFETIDLKLLQCMAAVENIGRNILEQLLVNLRFINSHRKSFLVLPPAVAVTREIQNIEVALRLNLLLFFNLSMTFLD